jgi:hypothetical protein
MKPGLLYFGHVPLEGAGSAIIVARHLRRFADDGWAVRVVADWGQDHDYCRAAAWPVDELSHRRWWWPPFNPDHAVSRDVRAWLWAGQIRAQIGDGPVAAVLTYLSAFSDTLSIAAVGFARRYRLPLAALVHDDPRCFAPTPAESARVHHRRQWILAHSTRAWFASPELAACYELTAAQSGTLPPISEGKIDGLSALSSPPLGGGARLIYAGNYWPPQLPTLVAIAAAAQDSAGRLLVVIKKNVADFCYLQAHGVECLPPFPRNAEALVYYREHASALVVSYADTSAEMPWTRSSFPSKLIEYCHLGVPIVIVAPEDTAVVRWARVRGFPDVFAPGDRAGLGEYVSHLRDPAFRRQRATFALSLAHGEFDPAAVHRQLASSFAPVSA